MENNLREKLISVAKADRAIIGENENNVKHKILGPFLNYFGFEELLDFEHSAQGSRFDINIGAKSDSDIVVETKRYNMRLDECIEQLNDYCKKKNPTPLLAILANGEEIRIYSPEMKRTPQFSERIIYFLKRSDLANDEILERLDKILSKENLENEAAAENIDEREKEIREGRKEIEQNRNELNKQITAIEKKIEELEKSQVDTERQIKEKYLLPDLQQIIKPDKTIRTPDSKPKSGEYSQFPDQTKYEKSYDADSYIARLLKNRNSQPAKIYAFIKSNEIVTKQELFDHLRDCGYKNPEKSGAISACITALRTEGHISQKGKSNYAEYKIEKEIEELEKSQVDAERQIKEKHPLPDLQLSQFPDYVQKRIKAIQNPSSMTHKMLNYIKDNRVATKKEIRDFIIDLYDNPGSGSIDGNLNTLRHLGLIKYDERGEYAKVHFIKSLD